MNINRARLQAAWAMAAVAAVVALSATTPASATSAATYVDKKVGHCTGQCGTGVAVNYWYKKGSHSRGVGQVYASKDPVKSGTKLYARWLYQEPGGSSHVGKSWRKMSHRAQIAEVFWGKDGHTGPKFPKNTKICTQVKGHTTKACITLK